MFKTLRDKISNFAMIHQQVLWLAIALLLVTIPTLYTQTTYAETVGPNAVKSLQPLSNTTITETGSNFPTYDNPSVGISIQYPSIWGLAQRSGSVEFMPPMKEGGITIILSFLNSGNMTLDAWTSILLKQIATIQNPIGHIETSVTSVNGTKAHLLTYTTSNTGLGNIVGETFVVVSGKKTYLLDYHIESDRAFALMPIIQKMIGSIEISKSPTSIETSIFSKYDNPISGISIRYPYNWSVIENNRTAEFFPSENSSNSSVPVSLEIDNIHPLKYMSVNRMLSNVINYDKTFPGFHFISLIPTSVAGNSGYRLLYNFYNASSGMNKVLQNLATVLGDNVNVVYTAPLTKYSFYLPVVQKMIDTLIISPSNLTSHISGTGIFSTYKNYPYRIKTQYPYNWQKLPESESNETELKMISSTNLSYITSFSPMFSPTSGFNPIFLIANSQIEPKPSITINIKEVQTPIKVLEKQFVNRIIQNIPGSHLISHTFGDLNGNPFDAVVFTTQIVHPVKTLRFYYKGRYGIHYDIYFRSSHILILSAYSKESNHLIRDPIDKFFYKLTTPDRWVAGSLY